MVSKHHAPPLRVSLADALFPKVRQRVLAVLFNAPQRSFFMGEVIALAHSGTGAVQRELADLAAAGILSVHKVGKQKHYQANALAPLFDVLSALVAKSMGVVNVLHDCLQPLRGQVTAGFVVDDALGASGAKSSAVTVVLFALNSDDSGVVAQALQNAANTLARPVRFTLYTPEALANALAQRANFLTRLLQPAKTWLVGNQDQLFSQPS